MILALQTTTFSAHGGIPTYNRCVCRVLDDLDNGTDAHVLVAMDTPADVAKQKNYPHLRIEGFAGGRAAFVWRALTAGLRQEIELVVIGHVHYAPLGLLLKRLRPKLRYGVMVHGVEAWPRLPFAQRSALQRADFIASVSEYTKRQLVEVNGVQADQIYIVPDTLEWEGRRAQSNGKRASAQDRNDDLTMLSVCRLEASERYKGIDTVIRALPDVLTEIPNLNYVVVGTGNDLDRHRQLARELGVAGHVQFLGNVDDAVLRARYETCDLFVMPSAGEGFGIVYLEAMQYCKPVIAANCTAVPEVVADGVTGLLVEYDNATQLSQAILRLARDRGLRNTMGQAGYQRLQEKFTFAHFQQQLTETLLRELPGTAFCRNGSEEGSVNLKTSA